MACRASVVAALILTVMAVLLVVAGIAGIVVTANKDKTKDEQIREVKEVKPRKNNNGTPAKCNELKPVAGLDLKALMGFWVLQEKLEFPDGMTHHNTVPNRDQTAICLRTEVAEPTDKEAALKTSFFVNNKLQKNFTGFVKVKDTGHWDFHMLNKDHDGMVVDAEYKSYFVFIECVKPASGGEYNVPGAVFVYTRGNLPESQMDRIRTTIESMLRHNDETFLDFGAYCF